MTSLDHAIHDARNAITVAQTHEHPVVVAVPVAALKWLVTAAELYRERPGTERFAAEMELWRDKVST